MSANFSSICFRSLVLCEGNPSSCAFCSYTAFCSTLKSRHFFADNLLLSFRLFWASVSDLIMCSGYKVFSYGFIHLCNLSTACICKYKQHMQTGNYSYVYYLLTLHTYTYLLYSYSIHLAIQLSFWLVFSYYQWLQLLQFEISK